VRWCGTKTNLRWACAKWVREVVIGNLLDLDSINRLIAGCETMYFGIPVSDDYLAAEVNRAAPVNHHGVKAFTNMSQMGQDFARVLTSPLANPQLRGGRDVSPTCPGSENMHFVAREYSKAGKKEGSAMQLRKSYHDFGHGSSGRNMMDLPHVIVGGVGGLRRTAAVLTRIHVRRIPVPPVMFGVRLLVLVVVLRCLSEELCKGRDVHGSCALSTSIRGREDAS
jgi:hypothetical protein